MAVVRHYECDCGCKFEKFHFEKPIELPECPACSILTRPGAQVPAGFSIGSSKSKAMDLTQKIVEEDYGMSNMKDNLRVGDVAAMTPPAIAPAVAGFFNAGARPMVPAVTMPGVLAAAKQNAAINHAEGRNPIAMLQKSMQASGRQNAKVLCRPLNKVN